MRALKGTWGPVLSAALAALVFLALGSPVRTQEEPVEPIVEGLGAVGTLRGRVEEIDFGEGQVEVATEAGTIPLRARPFDLVTLSPGDDVTLRYARFGEEVWLTPVFLDLLPQPGGTFRETKTLTGQITAVDLESARVLVEDTVLRVHPAQLRELVPGQLVSVTYIELEGESWLGAIDPAGAPATTGPAGIGAQDVVPGGQTEGVGPGVPTGSDSFPRGSYAVPGFGSDVYLDELGPIGTQVFPPEEADDEGEEEEEVDVEAD